MTLKEIKNLSTKEERETVIKYQKEDTRKKLILISGMFLILGLVYFISDLITGLYHSEFGHINLSAVIILLGSSSLVLALVLYFKGRLDKILDYLTAFYFISIISVMLLLLSSDLIVGRANYLLAYYNFLLLSFIIYYNIYLCFILEGITLVSTYLVLGFLVEAERTGAFMQSTLILLGFMVIQHYLRIVKTRSLYQQVELEDISKASELSSTIDFLTKLSNRKGLDIFINKNVNEAIENNLPITISMIDIDDFKAYNDFYSHMAGDTCLIKLGKVLSDLTNDRLQAFRYGGEEFLMIGIGLDSQEVREFNFSILRNVMNLKIDRQKTISVMPIITVSIGNVYNKCANMDEFMSLLKKADDKLYESKRDGKNRVTF